MFKKIFNCFSINIKNKNVFRKNLQIIKGVSLILDLESFRL